MDSTASRIIANVCDLEAEVIVDTDEWSRRPFHVHLVRDAVVRGGAFPVCVLERDGRNVVLSESSDYAPWAVQWADTAFATEPDAEVVGEVNEACSLALPHNFCHWHQEALPKICIMEKLGFSGCYVIADVPMFVESLQLIGIDRDRIYPLAHGSLRVSRLFVPQALPLANGSLYPMALWNSRVRCLENAEATVPAPRLLISRSPTTHRHIVGEEALLEQLDRYAITCVRMEAFSLQQQIGLASSAKLILGPHGAGMANTLFMQKHGLVLEMFSPLYINTCILPICRLLDLSYFPIVSKVNPVNGYAHGENILPDLELILLYMERHLA